MKTQNFNDHIKKHPLFHYFLVPVSLALIVAAAIGLLISFSLQGIILFMLTILLHLVIFLARDYAKKNQDRIIRTEMRLRYFILTGQNLEALEYKLSFSQLAALRFAADDELLQLLNNPAVFEKPGIEIKQQIQNWKPDHMRV